MDFRKHLENAWNLTLKHLVTLILMTLVMGVVSVLTIGILMPVMLAGYFQAILTMMRDGREPNIQDLFSQLNLFLPLFAFSIVLFVAMLIGFMLFFLPGIAVLCVIIFGCLYLLPLMTDKKKQLVEAIKTSWQMAVQDNLADHLVVVILVIGLTAIGSSVFVGTLFTLPFTTVFIVSVYCEKTAQETRRDVNPPTPPQP